MEPFRDGRVSDLAPPSASQVVRGDRALLCVDGEWVAAALRGSFAAAGRAPAAEEDDLRTMPVRYEDDGSRYREFREGVARLSESPHGDWPVAGPRTMKWIARELARQEQTPLRRHHWWRQILRLGPAEFGVAEHEAIMRVIETAMTYDQIRVSECASFELLSRRLQLIEERYAKLLMEAEAGKDHEDKEYEMALFMGASRPNGSALICPALTEFISGRLREEASILKERRKGREERQLARGIDAGASGSHGGGGPPAGQKGGAKK